MFCQTTEYALRAAAFLARRYPVGCNSQEVAAATQVRPGYMSKVLMGLAKAGIVKSQRGLGGGFCLARDPAKITILDVVSVFDSIDLIERCPLGLPEHAELCLLHRRLNEATGVVRQSLGGTTLAELGGAISGGLCEKHDLAAAKVDLTSSLTHRGENP